MLRKNNQFNATATATDVRRTFIYFFQPLCLKMSTQHILVAIFTRSVPEDFVRNYKLLRRGAMRRNVRTRRDLHISSPTAVAPEQRSEKFFGTNLETIRNIRKNIFTHFQTKWLKRNKDIGKIVEYQRPII